ncbi:nuclear transport factor 2 family protein [bacterium]|nr:MAG: nuclear transport factor 2 family protein [bacterium]
MALIAHDCDPDRVVGGRYNPNMDHPPTSVATRLADEQAIRDLGYRFADACTRRETEAFRTLWIPEGVWSISEPLPTRCEGIEAIVATYSYLLALWDFFVQMPHAPVVTVDGDRATSSWTMCEHANSAERAQGYFNYGMYDDVLVRTADGWRYESRSYTYIYLDETPAAGRPHNFFAATAPVSGPSTG